MKRRLLDLLICPTCRGSLTLEAERSSGPEVLEGTLRCVDCRALVPVRAGIPRFVPDEAYAASFGFEWTRWNRLQVDSASGTRRSEEAFIARTGLGRSDVAGRLLLDAGVGSGRFADVVARWGGEVVGIDLTRAVDAAWANVGTWPNVHLVQADILAMPFAEQTFDIAYSIGVLHHTPDPPRAFSAVAASVRKGGAMAVYVYPAYGVDRHFSDTIRTLTTRLPVRLMFYLASLAAPLYPLYRLPVIGRVLGTLCPISMHPDARWRWLDTFDWYTPRYQFKYRYPEVYRWFADAGYGGVHILDEPISMRATREAA